MRKNKLLRYFYSNIPNKLKPERYTHDRFLNFIKSTENFDQDTLKNFQLKKLKEIVSYAWENIDGYRQLWSENNFYPSKLVTLKDIEQIPFITKEVLRNNLGQFTNKKGKGFQITTGGSSGSPFGFYVSRKNLIIEQAFISDIWSRCDSELNFYSKSVVLRGNITKGLYEFDPLKGLILSSYNINKTNAALYVNLINDVKYPILQAYPSSLYLLAKYIKQTGIMLKHQFKLIALGSEPLFDFQRELINDVFVSKIVHWYGQSEMVVLGGNCSKSNAFHLYPQYGITEIVKSNNQIASNGEIGEIVGTSFWNLKTPFIRYRTNDFAELGDDCCSLCGLNYQILRKIEGRLQDLVVDNDRNVITLTALIFAQHFNAFKNIKQIWLEQNKIGKVIINISPTENFDSGDKEEIIKKIKKASNFKIQPSITINHVPPLTSSGKIKFLVQNLDLSKYQNFSDA